MTSEFGRGYATCLRQFANHRKRLDDYLKSYRKMRTKGPNPGGVIDTQEELDEVFSDARAVELWMNGASDHLYDLIRPVRVVSRAQWKAAQALQDRALYIGHGFGTRGPTNTSVAEAESLLAAADGLLESLAMSGLSSRTLDECFVTDRYLGLAPDSGTYECPEDFSKT